MPRRPLPAVARVTLDGVAADPSEYRWHHRGLLQRSGGWGDEVTTVEVEGDWGRDLLPSDLALVVSSAAARLAANPQGLRSLQRAEGRGDAIVAARVRARFTLAELAVLHRWRVRASG